MPSTDIVVIGLAITSSWGNGHASTWRSLIKGLAQRGHRVLFLECDRPWYAQHRDALQLPYCDTQLYADTTELRTRFTDRVRSADAVIVGSYVHDGAAVCDWVLDCARGVRAFYDIDTPVTMSRLRSDSCWYLKAEQIPQFDLMLSFTGGPILRALEASFGARRAVPLYCSVDPDQHRKPEGRPSIELGYLGTYSADRQPGVEALLNEPARRLPERGFVVAGAQYPAELTWPTNVRRIEHLPPAMHAAFYAGLRFTLNVTRADMRRAGYSPSVRLFEAAACATPIISDDWPGLAEFLAPDSEVLIAHDTCDVLRPLREMSEEQRLRIARDARERVLTGHSGLQRAKQLEDSLKLALRGQT